MNAADPVDRDTPPPGVDAASWRILVDTERRLDETRTYPGDMADAIYAVRLRVALGLPPRDAR